MIVRSWTGLARPDAAEAYIRHLAETVVPELERIAGYRGIQVLRRDTDEGPMFTVVTWWSSMEAVRAFAGEDERMAVVPPAAQALMVRYDPLVAHHEVAYRSEPQSR